jgi:hypothetical protein
MTNGASGASGESGAAVERTPFLENEIPVIKQAIEISEDVIGDFYRISTSEWKRFRYDIQSLKDLSEDEVTDCAFAQIRRYASRPDKRLRGGEPGDYFKICLQDHRIRKAVSSDPGVRLLPLATYVVTHELIHVVRFAKFLHRFHTTDPEREAEERRVHLLTYQLLAGAKIAGLPEVLGIFEDYRIIESLF